MDRTFPASIEKLYDMLEYISSYADTLGFQKDIIKNIQLVAEEALINVILHGYKQDTGDISITLKETSMPGIEITIIDSGQPFSPENYPDTTPLENSKDSAPVGGLGLFLIYKIMDKVEYSRDGEKNVLRLQMLLKDLPERK